jgi:hypothetical protein
MIKSITVTNHLGESIKLELTRPEKSGFIVLPSEGLVEPVKATINTTKIATLDGATYNSAYLEQRDIVLNLRFLESATETIEDIRLKSYRYFPERRRIKLVIETDRHIVETHGYVEHNKPEVFSEMEGASITILCADPYLYSTEIGNTTFSGVTPAFSFPFSNESMTEPTLIFGVIEHKTEDVIYYDGDSNVGMTIIIHATGEVGNLAIYNVTAREQMRIDTAKLAALTGSGIISGDTITIETKQRNKSITLLRDGVAINILNCLDRGTAWLTLTKGDNIIAYRAESGSSNVQFRVEYRNAYEGV